MPDTTPPVPRRLRYEVLRRDGHTCRYCGASAPDVPLTVDHIIPRALGGTNDPTNLITACDDCNSGKASTAPDQGLVEDADERATRWAAAMQQAATQERSARQSELAGIQMFYNTWTDIMHTDDALPYQWEQSVATFIKNGLGHDDLTYAIEVTVKGPVWSGQRQFRYFCGVCWRIIRDRQQRALSILESED